MYLPEKKLYIHIHIIHSHHEECIAYIVYISLKTLHI